MGKENASDSNTPGGATRELRCGKPSAMEFTRLKKEKGEGRKKRLLFWISAQPRQANLGHLIHPDAACWIQLPFFLPPPLPFRVGCPAISIHPLPFPPPLSFSPLPLFFLEAGSMAEVFFFSFFLNATAITFSFWERGRREYGKRLVDARKKEREGEAESLSRYRVSSRLAFFNRHSPSERCEMPLLPLSLSFSHHRASEGRNFPPPPPQECVFCRRCPGPFFLHRREGEKGETKFSPPSFSCCIFTSLEPQIIPTFLLPFAPGTIRHKKRGRKTQFCPGWKWGGGWANTHKLVCSST